MGLAAQRIAQGRVTARPAPAAHRDTPQAGQREASERAELAQGQQVGVAQGGGTSQVQLL